MRPAQTRRPPAPQHEEPAPLDLKALRQRLGLTQAAFAERYGLVLGSLRNWEQGLRRPSGPVRLLLRIIAQDSEAVVQALAAERQALEETSRPPQ
jgi:DNA-binding transcriptional regulator YiaG